MIELLVVEDSPRKIQRIVELAERVLLDLPIRIDTAANVFDAAQLVSRRAYDVLVLDLQLPRRDGEPPAPEGGIELLKAITSSKRYLTPGYIVGLTAYPELADLHKRAF